MNYKQGFCTNAEVFIMDEGIEMMPIEQTSSEPQFPWWVSQVSTDEDKIVAFKARACRRYFARGTRRPNSPTSQVRVNYTGDS